MITAGAAVCLGFASCSDEDAGAEARTPQQTGQGEQEQMQEPPAIPPEILAEAVLPAEIRAAAWLEMQEIRIGPIKDREQKLYPVEALFRLREPLCEKTDVSASLNEERKAVNPAIDRAMTPESVYLLQVGAAPEMLTEEDRKFRPMPENLREKAEHLVKLANPEAWKISVPAGETLSLQGTMRLESEQGREPAIVSAELDSAAWDEWQKLTPASSLPEWATVFSEESLERHRQAIQAAVKDFNDEAEPYIKSREEATRVRLLEERARAEEEKKARELAENEARAKAAAARERYERAAAAGSVYRGEWSHDEQTGKLALTFISSDILENSAALTAELSDPDFSQVNVELQGRCLLEPEEGTSWRFQIAIVDGLYDPDVATAEIYNEKEGVLLLNLTDQGTLEGILTCKSWTDEQKKARNVKVILRPVVRERKKCAEE